MENKKQIEDWIRAQYKTIEEEAAQKKKALFQLECLLDLDINHEQDTPIDEIGISKNVVRWLRAGGIEWLSDLQDKTWKEVKHIRNIGDKASAEIESVLNDKGINLPEE